MNAYSIALFVHVTGALGFFIALALEGISLLQLRYAQTADQVREWLQFSSKARRLGIASMLLILVAGFYMMAVAQIGSAWLIVAFWDLVLLTLLGLILSGPRLSAIQRMADLNGPIQPGLSNLLNHPLLRISLQTRISIALGIVFLMTVKPDLPGSLLVSALAVLLGLASALPLARREQPGERVNSER